VSKLRGKDKHLKEASRELILEALIERKAKVRAGRRYKRHSKHKKRNYEDTD
jgi:hypothetical protein